MNKKKTHTHSNQKPAAGKKGNVRNEMNESGKKSENVVEKLPKRIIIIQQRNTIHFRRLQYEIHVLSNLCHCQWVSRPWFDIIYATNTLITLSLYLCILHYIFIYRLCIVRSLSIVRAVNGALVNASLLIVIAMYTWIRQKLKCTSHIPRP